MTPETTEVEDRAPSRAAVALFGLIFGLTALLAALSFPAGLYTVLFTTLKQGYSAATEVYTFVWAGPVPVEIPVAVPVGVLFVLVTAVYAAFFAYAASRRRNVLAAFSDGFRSGLSAIMSNDLVAAFVALGVYMFTAVIINLAVIAGGAPIGGLSEGNPLFYLVTATLSPLREEAGFRLGIIGVVALLLAIGTSGRGMLNALWRPASAYEGSPSKTGKMLGVMMALGFSAVIFGLWHVFSGSGWDIGKLPGVIFGGLVLGYAYIKYGFHVAVLAHWGVDYLGLVFGFFGQGVYGIDWTSTPGFVIQDVVTLDLVLGIGLASTLVVAYLGLSKLGAPKQAPQPPEQVAGSS